MMKMEKRGRGCGQPCRESDAKTWLLCEGLVFKLSMV